MFYHVEKFFIFIIFIQISRATLPPYINVCQSNDPKLTACIINTLYQLKPKLKQGIPELNVPSLEPLYLDEVKLRSGPNQAKIDANITNLKVWGPSTFEILELRPNIPKARFTFKVNIPFLHFEGDYDIDMKILLLKYKGQGPIVGNFTNFKFDCILKGNKIKRNGDEYLSFNKMQLRLNPSKASIKLDNLFQNDPVLGRATNDIVNDNSDLFIQEILPVLELSLAEKFTQIANGITLKFTYKELFP